MTPISMPAAITANIKGCRFGLEYYTRKANESPINRSVQTMEGIGARWMATYILAPLKESEDATDEVKAFLMKLRGQVNTFYAIDPARTAPKGVATGTPLVKGASQTGNTLLTDGWTPDVTGILKVGDYFTVNGEFKKLTATSNSDGSGNATLTFEAPLRNSPADNAPLTVSSPTCIMRLTDDNQAFWDCDADGWYNFVITAVETFF